jgi:nickel-dependent lactate racemase
MPLKTIKLPQLAWHGRRKIELPVPDSWQVNILNMSGFDAAAMNPEQIKAALNKPIGSPTIADLARDKQEIVIIFDDMSRGTRAAQIIPFILEELAMAKIPDSRIRFLSALGCHGSLDRLDFVNKLGEEVVSRFPVYNHNAFACCCTDVGTTRHGIKVSANTEALKCDFKIAIGSIVPHIMAGFGGGSKIILPGITSLETNEAFHRLGSRIRQEHPDIPIGMGIYKDNPLRHEMEEAAAMVGLDIKIDCITNMWGETAHIFAGNPLAEFAAGVEVARKHYLSPRTTGNDVVIANISSKVNEPEGGVIQAIPSVSNYGGDMVMICHAPEGHVTHHLMGTFGRKTRGPIGVTLPIPPQVNRLIIFNEYPDLTFADPFDPRDKVIMVDKWDQVLKLIDDRCHTKQTIKVAVYPNADIQYCAPTAA